MWHRAHWQSPPGAPAASGQAALNSAAPSVPVVPSGHAATARATVQVDMSPSAEVKQLLRALSETHTFFLVSGRVKSEMAPWFHDVPEIGICSEHGYYRKAPGSSEFVNQYPGLDFSWKEIVLPIMQMYADSTDGSYVQVKDCGLTWAYAAADPDFGRWQVRAPPAPALMKLRPK